MGGEVIFGFGENVAIVSFDAGSNFLVWGIKMMVAGWVYWQPCFEQSQQNRTMPRDSRVTSLNEE